MGRSRVLSFMSTFGGGPPRSPPAASPATFPTRPEPEISPSPQSVPEHTRDSISIQKRRTSVERPSSTRPMSMIGAYQPPLMEIAQDTLPELQPIFTFLNSHSNKLYQEGYFLKLNDLDSHGRPYPDRSWTECFAQLVGTVLSLWDAALLDEAGQDGEVAPTFINLADASIKMIETLPTRSQDVQPLANVLSISTAGKNRYLFHFSNINALTQWTAGIRLAMYEHATLQEAYTGSLIAGKGKTLNNIRVIMDRTKLVTEEWTRVRFGAGTPWRRCWCVISPPNEKEVLKQQKSLKKKSAYDLKSVILKGDIKFYDTKKTKKVEPIATIKDAYSAYAIYPQSKPLIDQSTLVKIEGMITIHSKPEATTEGFIFVMPETRPAITGFEMMLRFLFPVYDIFGLYGRPTRLIADILDTRSLMFAMPQERRYGYLEILDVATLIHTDGSQGWNESEWRKQLKLLTSQRITKIQASGSRTGSRIGSRRSHRNSLPARTDQLRYEDGASIRSTPSLHRDLGPFAPPQHTGSAPVGTAPFQPPQKSLTHQRSVSEAAPFSTPRRQRTIQEGSPNYTPSRLSYEQNLPRELYEPVPPPPPAHGLPAAYVRNPQLQRYVGDNDSPNERSSSESERRYRSPSEPHNHAQNIQQGLSPNAPPAPVATPPAFAHQPGAKPQTRPYHSPELRRANSRMSSTTLSQLAAAGNVASSGGAAGGGVAMAGAAAAWKGSPQQRDEKGSEDQSSNAAVENNFSSRAPADRFDSDGMVLAGIGQPRPNDPRQVKTGLTIKPQQSNSAITPENLSPTSRGFLVPTPTSPRSVSPLSQSTTYATSPPPQELGAAAGVQSSHDDAARAPAMIDNDATSSAETAGLGTSSLPDDRPDLRRHSTSRSISRKPLPSPSKSDVPPVPKHYSTVDDAVQSPRRFSEDDRRQSMQSSNYDNESTASPDYASARQSAETGRRAGPVEKPRTGVLKTVGTVDPADQEVLIGDARYRPDMGTQQYTTSALPAVDFGPTQAYRPDTMQLAHGRTGSYNGPSSSPHYEAQADAGRSGYGRSSPGDSYNSRNLVTPEPNNRRSGSADSDNENRRNVAWQPGMTAGSGSPGARQSITPEQYVQQRAAANRVVPVYSHGRNRSETPPLHSHQSSGDLSGQYANQDSPSRPHSRGASTVMNASPDYSARLSAREQEHVARVTGSPLINVAGNNSRIGPPSGGLVGAIEAREQEKKAMKQGVSGQMVQQAIAQRQQHAQAQGYVNQGPQYANQSSQYPQPSPQMHIPGGYPQTPQMPYGGFTTPQQQQQYLMNQQYGQQQQYNPGASVYWNTAPSPYLQYPPTPGGGQRQSQSPGPQSPQYNPYFNSNPQGGR
ncbi:hypothetical protein MMC32_000685 [Xylographa parallela]|nr:hypothetical protein [Xylographa parallela]